MQGSNNHKPIPRQINQGTRYSEAEKQLIIQKLIDGQSPSEIARESKISSQTITKWAKDYGLDKRTSIKKEDPRIEKTVTDIGHFTQDYHKMKRQLKTLLQYTRKLERIILANSLSEPKDSDVISELEKELDN